MNAMVEIINMGVLTNDKRGTLGAYSVNCMPSSLDSSYNTGSFSCSPGPDEQRSLVKLAQVIRDNASSLLEALAGERSLLSALQTMKRSHAFRLSNDQAQETSQCRPAPPKWLDELGFESLSWCLWE